MFQPTRDEGRAAFIEAWRRARQGEPLEPLQDLCVGIIARHPEYHAVLEDAERHVHRDWTPESGETNPFLHLAMHLAVLEQLSIDRPTGIRAAFEALCRRQGDRHRAEHAVMECIAEALWTALRTGIPVNEAAYLKAVRRRSRK